jgi:hypothetical protein
MRNWAGTLKAGSSNRIAGEEKEKKGGRKVKKK